MSTQANLSSAQLVARGAGVIMPASTDGVALAATPHHGTAPTALELLQLAIEKGANADQIAKLLDLHDRLADRERRLAYDSAMRDFKSETIVILKNEHVSYQPKDRSKDAVEYNYASLDNVCDVLIPRLAEHGIYHSWKVDQDREYIKVSCTLRHEKGHFETTTLGGCPDVSGGKNPIQAIASTVSYLERYTLLAAVGMATKDQDDDARSAGDRDRTIEASTTTAPAAVSNGKIPRERVQAISRQLAAASSVEQLQGLYFAEYRLAQQSSDRFAMSCYESAKNDAKRRLAKAVQQ